MENLCQYLASWFDIKKKITMVWKISRFSVYLFVLLSLYSCLSICLFIPVYLLGDKFSLKYILVNTYNTRHLDRKKAPRGVYNVPRGAKKPQLTKIVPYVLNFGAK